MSVRIDIPLYLMPFTGNIEKVAVRGSTVGECLKNLVKQYPDIEKMLFDRRGRLLDYVGIYVNREDAYPEGLDKPVKDGDELGILYVIGGG